MHRLYLRATTSAWVAMLTTQSTSVAKDFAMNFSRRRFAPLLAPLALGGMALTPVRTAAQPASSPGRSDARRWPVGAWRVQLSGLGPAPVPILMTFNGDGTLLQTDTPVSLPQPVPPSSAASNGHGAWRKVSDSQFSFTYVKIFYGNDGPALAVATQRGTLTLAADGNTFEARLTGTDFVNATDGTPIGTGAPAALTYAGTRIVAPD
jgi:hypothetical protein